MKARSFISDGNRMNWSNNMAGKYSKYHVDISNKGKKDRTAFDRNSQTQVVFDSKLEKQYYIEVICGGLDSGLIKQYALQKKYQLQPSFKRNGKSVRAIDYMADFWIEFSDGTEQVIDIKGGLVDPMAKLKRKITWLKYPELDYCWLTYTKATGWIDWDEYEAIKRQRKKEKKEKQKC